MINTILLLVFAFVAVAIQSSLFSVMLPQYLSIDLVLVMSVYVVLKRELKFSVPFCLFLSYLVSLNSGAGFFPYLLLMTGCFAITKYIALNFFTGTARSVLWCVLFSVGIPKLIFVLWLHWADAFVLLRAIPSVLSSSLVTSLISLLLFRAFSYLDTATGVIEPEYIKERHRRF